MHRFFVSPDEVQNNEIHFSPVVSRQINRVLRLKNHDRVVVLDNSGIEMQTELILVNDTEAVGRIVRKEQCKNEPGVRLLMILSLTQREKFEWMLQKCTEVGASVFVPMITSRSMSHKSTDVKSKYPRWKMILKEAAEQSNRGIIPTLMEPLTFNEVLKVIPREYPLCLMAWENESHTNLRDLLRNKDAKAIAVMVGPEGGFSESEVELVVKSGFIPVTLGKRILRMETAAVVAAALVLHEVEGD